MLEKVSAPGSACRLQQIFSVPEVAAGQGVESLFSAAWSRAVWVRAISTARPAAERSQLPAARELPGPSPAASGAKPWTQVTLWAPAHASSPERAHLHGGDTPRSSRHSKRRAAAGRASARRQVDTSSRRDRVASCAQVYRSAYRMAVPGSKHLTIARLLCEE
jgi:hypothetical protein